MKMKTTELIGDALNWAVAKCEGIHPVRCGAGPSQYLAYVPKRSAYKRWRPTSNWAQGGPIADRERINVTLIDDSPDIWSASLGDPWRTLPSVYGVTGPTRLVAMMRCYVLSKLGAEVDIPDCML